MAGVTVLFLRARRLLHPYLNRANLIALLTAAALSSAAYILGAWNHSAFTLAASSTFHAAACNESLPHTNTLDFSLHHSEPLAAAPTAARHRFPACEPKYTEYTPCEDTDRSLKFPRDRLIYRERHCPEKGELLRCLVAAPPGYRIPPPWPESRDEAWFANVPHKELAVEKSGQNWVKVVGDRFLFPGGGTMFTRGAGGYVDEIGQVIPLHDGSIRTAIDTGCGVASWGAYLLSRNIIAMSFAPRDTHEAQVQFALERGIPAIIGILASNRLPYPSRSFDMAHCSRCLIPWHLYDGLFLIELDRILRPGGYWILSGPPINWKRHWKSWGWTEEDLGSEQSTIESTARSLCWKKIREKGDIAIWQKPTNHIHCKATRKVFRTPPFCWPPNPDAAWYTKMESCITPLPDVSGIREIAGGELKKWPERLWAVPPRISNGGIGGVTPEMFLKDSELWKRRVEHYKLVIKEFGGKGRYRNILDMNSGFGGFAAALVDDPVWVMNVVPNVTNVDTLGIVYERGLIGTYQDWCEAMSTYPRTYDLLHADSLFSLYNERCEMEDILLEMDRILRPQGTAIFRDDVDVLVKIKSIADVMRWESRIEDHEDGPFERAKILLAVKSYWTSSDGEKPQ